MENYHFPFNIIVKSLTLHLAKMEVLFSHYPYRPVDRSDLHKYPEDKGGFLVHGHSHSGNRQKKRQLNVCCDFWNYSPVSIKEVEALIKKMK